MAKFTSTLPLDGISPIKGKNVSISVQPTFMMAQVFALKGKSDALARKLKIKAEAGVATQSAAITALPLSPGQWMLVSKNAKGMVFADLEKSVAKNGYASQQSESRVCIRVSGPMARELMSRGCRLDLHPQNTGKDFCAQTQMAQIGVIIHQVSDAPEYDLYVYSGFAHSFWHWLEETAAQFG